MIRVLVAGLGNMGQSHALAYHKDPRFQIVGLVNRTARDLPEELQAYPLFTDYARA
jgi:predicted dehydrogenase